MEGIKSTITSLILIGLFAVALIAFAIRYETVNDSSVKIQDDPAIATFKNSLDEQLDAFTDDVNDSDTSFRQSTPEAIGDSILVLSVASIWKTLVTVPKEVYQLTAGLLFDKIFGDAGFYIFFTTIGVLLTVTIIFYAWRFIKSGEP